MALPEVCCHEGHGLVLSDGDLSAMIGCNGGCEVPIVGSEPRWSCTPCGYDVCDDCMQAQRAARGGGVGGRGNSAGGSWHVSRRGGGRFVSGAPQVKRSRRDAAAARPPPPESVDGRGGTSVGDAICLE